MWPSMAKLRKKWTMFSVATSPMVGRVKSIETSGHGLPDRSTTALDSDSSSGTYAYPKRVMPDRSPSAESSARPSRIAQSSTV